MKPQRSRILSAVYVAVLLLLVPISVTSCGGCGASSANQLVTGSNGSRYEMSPSTLESWCDTLVIKAVGGNIPSGASVTFHLHGSGSPGIQTTGGTVDNGVMYAGLPKDAQPGEYDVELNLPDSSLPVSLGTVMFDGKPCS